MSKKKLRLRDGAVKRILTMSKLHYLRIGVLALAASCGDVIAAENNSADTSRALLRVAILSDIQGYPYPEDSGMRNLERALDVFSKEKIDVVVNNGDINDTGRDSDALAYYRKRCDERLGLLPHIACMGNHEIAFVPPELKDIRSSRVCLAGFNAVFGYAPGEQLVHRVVGGHDFIALSLDDAACYRECDIKLLETAIDKAVSRDGGKPIFVVTHYHPKDTVNDSDNEFRGGGLLRRLLDRYPQVVSISGHTHNPLQDPRSIWQGNFTAVDTSTLCYGCVSLKPPAVNQISCLIPYGHESVGCMILDVFADKLVFRRFSVRDRAEIEPENRWTVPWPHDPANAPYSFERRRLAEVPASFQADAEPTLWYDFGYIYIMFGTASPRTSVFGYRIELIPEGGNAVSHFLLSDFYRIAAHRQERIVFKAPPGALTPGTRYRCRIFPVGFFGAEGKPIDWSFDVQRHYTCRQDVPNFVQE